MTYYSVYKGDKSNYLDIFMSVTCRTFQIMKWKKIMIDEHRILVEIDNNFNGFC